ncbi:acyltransferase [Xanthocytophaga agilis]|uniref:Acyltransferase n=1 Tax=Xanthocytophaga agilis TaxID=3048010 RepID=A0AAE3UJP7_9BACT|nr:acyltransferase [Xanthocytophaga agilis]MDJ1506282.1 acyltransferase [Xanthocytophaga agilis]
MYQSKAESSLLKTTQHFAILDGLRGIAAIAVVIFHFMEIIFPDPSKNFIAHAYLAVDFFFCLSGFVIAYAYDQRLPQISIATFFKLRLIRLHPLVLIGSVIGLLSFIFDPFSNLFDKYSGQSVLLFVTSCLMIPYPIVGERFFNLFHLNPPSWSLFWEYVANIAYAFILVRLPNKIIWVLVIISAVAIVYESYISGSLIVGWSGDNILGGAIRVSYSFIIGILVYRSKWIIQSRLGLIPVGILLMLSFLAPFVKSVNWLVDPLIVLFYFPFLVALGAGARLSSTLTKVCNFAGEISYPLYMTHYPFMWIFLSYVEAKKPTFDQMILIAVVGTVLLIVWAYLIMILLDIPFRTYLKNKLIKRLA